MGVGQSTTGPGDRCWSRHDDGARRAVDGVCNGYYYYCGSFVADKIVGLRWWGSWTTPMNQQIDVAVNFKDPAIIFFPPERPLPPPSARCDSRLTVWLVRLVVVLAEEATAVNQTFTEAAFKKAPTAYTYAIGRLWVFCVRSVSRLQGRLDPIHIVM